MAATTTLPASSAASDAPKLIKKASGSDAKGSTTPAQTTFGCQHVKNLFQFARDKVTEQYTRLTTSIQNDRNISESLHKSGDKVRAIAEPTYLCLQCTSVTCSRERHRKDHHFSVESTQGFVYCHECRDFVYDPAFEEIRTSNSKKRKASAMQADGDKRLLSTNASATPCAAVGLRGLYNMGQTCFMSVILQSLIHNPFIRTYFLSEGHRSIYCDREACTSCALDDIFIDFFGQEKHEGYGAVHMLQGCWKNGGGLAGYSQQDAHEYLGFILNSLHTAIIEDDENTSAPKDDRDCTCIIHQTFGGLLKSTVTCTACQNTTTALDPFMDLSLDIRSSTVSVKKKKLTMINGTQTVKELLPMNLTECLDRFTSAETLSSDNYHCRKCASNQESKKKLSLARLPPVIPIHLKRFSHSATSAQSSKVEARIRFPFTLDLAPYGSPAPVKPKNGKAAGKHADSAKDDEGGESASPDSPEPIYELSSVVVHKGKIDNGHYISYSRQGDEWFRFDDSMVVQVTEKEVLGAEAYMLIYVAREVEDGGPERGR